MQPTSENGLFCFGKGRYNVVILPSLATVRGTTLDVLDSFIESGGTVVIAGPAPDLVDCQPSTRLDSMRTIRVPFNKTSILEQLETVRDVKVTLTSGTTANSLLYQMRIDNKERYLFFCNTDRKFPRDTEISIRGQWTVTVLDTLTGDETKLTSRIQRKCDGDSWTKLSYRFEGCASLLLRLQPPESCPDEAPTVPELKWNVAGELELESVSLSEPNVLLIDMVRYRIDDEIEWSGLEEILRTDNIARGRLGLPLRQDNLAQPYRMPKEHPKHMLHLKVDFKVRVTSAITDAKLALEGLPDCTVVLNRRQITTVPDGWWVDESILTTKLPTLETGDHCMEISMPFGPRTNVERIYILGTFGVDLRGRHTTIVDLALDRLKIGDYTRQGLPFYAGDVRYEFAVAAAKGRSAIHVPRFAAPVLRVEVDGRPAGKLDKIALPPYILDLGDVVQRGSSPLRVSITAVGNRNNAFGAVHLPDGLTQWYGPDSFRTNGDKWSYEYVISEMGLLTAPRLLTADPWLASKTWDAGSVDQDLWFH